MQTIELTLVDAGRPASGVEVSLFVTGDDDPSCNAFAPDVTSAMTSDSRGQIVWRHEIRTTSGTRHSARRRINSLALCTGVGDSRRVLMRRFDDVPRRRLRIHCDLSLPPATRKYPSGGCVTTVVRQLDEDLMVPTIALFFLLVVRVVIARKNLPDRVGIGFLVVLLGIMSSSFLHRVPIVSQVLALPLLIGAVWTHIDLTLSRRRPGRR
jgi:hypothetical protein